jgi:hypothetical protein
MIGVHYSHLVEQQSLKPFCDVLRVLAPPDRTTDPVPRALRVWGWSGPITRPCSSNRASSCSAAFCECPPRPLVEMVIDQRRRQGRQSMRCLWPEKTMSFTVQPCHRLYALRAMKSRKALTHDPRGSEAHWWMRAGGRGASSS